MVLTKGNVANRYSPEIRERAVRMMFEHQGSRETQPSGEAGRAGPPARPAAIEAKADCLHAEYRQQEEERVT
jgi:hypothetical protein